MKVPDIKDGGFLKEVEVLLLGDVTLATYFVGLLFAIVGVLARKRFLVYKRNPNSGHSPKQFRKDYWWKYNKEPLFWTVVLILIIIRFYAEYVPKFAPDFYEKWPDLTMGAMFIIGIMFDYAIQKAIYAIRSKDYDRDKNVEKSVSIPVGSLDDKVIHVDGVLYNETVANLVHKEGSLFSVVTGDDGLLYLCTKVPKTIPTIIAKVKLSTMTEPTSLISSDMICEDDGNCKPVSR